MNVKLNTEFMSFSDPLPWSVQITRTEASSNGDVLYYFHGGASSPRSWTEKPELQHIREHWLDRGFAAPVVVSVSFGGHWLLAPKNCSPNSGLFEVFVNRVMPQVEDMISKSNFLGKRMVLGGSMGGFNASQLILRCPELFSRVAITSPAFSTLSIYSSDLEVMKHAEGLGAKLELLSQSIKVAQAFFADQESWREANPIELGDRRLGPKTPPLYISCGREDLYGFFDGAEKFAQLAMEKNVSQVTWQPLPGGHSDMDPKSIAIFLMAGSE